MTEQQIKAKARIARQWTPKLGGELTVREDFEKGEIYIEMMGCCRGFIGRLKDGPGHTLLGALDLIEAEVIDRCERIHAIEAKREDGYSRAHIAREIEREDADTRNLLARLK